MKPNQEVSFVEYPEDSEIDEFLKGSLKLLPYLSRDLFDFSRRCPERCCVLAWVALHSNNYELSWIPEEDFATLPISPKMKEEVIGLFSAYEKNKHFILLIGTYDPNNDEDCYYRYAMMTPDIFMYLPPLNKKDFPVLLINGAKPRLCANLTCTKENRTVKQCARCRLVRYCDADCQRADWKLHKPICLPPEAKKLQFVDLSQ